MHRYNKLKLRALFVFESAGERWLRERRFSGKGALEYRLSDGIEAAQKLDFCPRRSAWTYFKRLWRFGLLGRNRQASLVAFSARLMDLPQETDLLGWTQAKPSRGTFRLI
jgi:hypothetical protein